MNLKNISSNISFESTNILFIITMTNKLLAVCNISKNILIKTQVGRDNNPY